MKQFLQLVSDCLTDVKELMPWDLVERRDNNPDLLIVEDRPVLLALALLPTLVYVWSLSELAVPQGNIDTGATWGSYLGLLFLGSCFAAIGLFASSITENQIVSFLVAVFLCFIMFMGPDLLASFEAMGALEGPIKAIGIQEHYRSISRGVVDLRDVLYFCGVIAIALLLTRTALQSRTW